MSDNQSSNTRIAKNTLLLYLRMLLVLGLNLYISRLTLKYLGIVDYGIYNVVGGIVVFFSYLNSALTLAANRFISYDMKSDLDRRRVVFNTCFIIQFFFSITILLLCETIGIWLINNQLVIPEDRLFAANIVFQISVFTTILSIIRVPYESSIVAHEKMGTFALLSIIEVILKLLLAVSLSYAPLDILIYYGGGIFAIAICSYLIRYYACNKWFEECRLTKVFDSTLFKRVFIFTGWNLFGATAGVSVSQGLNFIINIFFGPTVNAARGIAIQVEGAINHFVTSINTAVNPQIVKRYSIDDLDGMYSLVFFASKVSFMLLLVVSMPILIDTSYVLGLWLGNVPNYACELTKIELMYIMTLSLTYSINMSAQATGNIKYFQIAEGTVMLLNLPIVYLLCRIGYNPAIAMSTIVMLSCVTFIVKLLVLKKTMKFPVFSYVKTVLIRVLSISMIGVMLFAVFHSKNSITLTDFITHASIYTFILLLSCYIIGLRTNEKRMMLSYVTRIIHSKK